MRLYKKKGRSENRRHPVARPDYLILESLEPRILLSADAIGGSFDASDTDFANPTLTQSHDDLRATLQFKLSHLLDHNPDIAFSATQPLELSQTPVPQSLDLDAFALLVTAPPTARVELIVVDADVPDTPQLLAQLRQDPAVDYQVHFLDANSSGVAQVSAILQNTGTVDAVHLLSHGAAGEWRLGSDRISADTMPQLENSLRQWESHLTADADILVYGCDVAAGDAGQTLLMQLANLTGADVAASENLTGVGGDWHLEFHAGVLESTIPFVGAIAAEWQHNLATITVTTHLDTTLPIGVDSVAELLLADDPVSLRQALQAANLDFSAGNATVHTIEFDLQGNYQIALTSALPQITAAVVIDGTSEADFAGTPLVTISGTGPLLRLSGDNITIQGLDLRGSNNDGLLISGDNNRVVGNVIVANAGNGISITGANNTIGGTTPEARNIISGNTKDGVSISGLSASGNSVLGNYIGTDASGMSALPNGDFGVRLANLNQIAATHSIGGLVAGAGNLISGNTDGGIFVGQNALHVDILGNRIGLDANGGALGNEGNGIIVKTAPTSPPGIFVPSDVLIQSNRIAHNDGIGVSVEDPLTHNVHIVENLIYQNSGLGIDLGGNGVTPNDPQDMDVGVNGQSNFPVINSVSVVGNQLRIVGNLNNAQETGPLQIHFYYSTTAHSSNHGDARGYIGSVTVTPNPGGNASFNSLFAVNVPDGSYITATATGNLGTSEFATNVFLALGNPANQAPTGEVAIAGSLIQGAVLTASNTIADPNGRSGPLQYQWLRNGVAISGATATTYTLAQADVGNNISVAASYTDDDGFAESVTSAPAGPIANLNDAPTGTVTISGSALEGATLAAVSGFADADGVPTTLNYQWLRNGVAIDDATAANYVLTQMDVGSVIRVRVDYQDLQGTNESLQSAATAPVVNVNNPPTGALAITGSAVEGQLLNANLGFSDGDGLTGLFNIQWYRDGVAISGATHIGYTLAQADVGKEISVRVAYTDAQGTAESINSLPTAVVANINDAPTGNLNILGDAREGEILTIDQDIADEDGLPANLNYQWYRDGVAITGATADSYAITQNDVGGRISVSVSYTDNFGAAESVTSSVTAPVANINNTPTGDVTISGNAEEGATLSAVVAIADLDGLPASFNYQWYRDGSVITEATGQNYVLTQADVGTAIHVSVNYVDLQGTSELIDSAATVEITNRNDPPVGTVNILGALTENQLLTAQPAFTDADGLPTEFNYQWYRDGEIIIGANAVNYQLQAQDIGARISVAVNYQDNYGANETVMSAASAPVNNFNDAPVGELMISGVATEDQTLTVSHAFTDADGLPAAFQYQWYRDGEAIDGATSVHYTLTDADVGSRMTAAVFYIDLYGHAETVASIATAPVVSVNDAPLGNLNIIGNPVEGSILTVSNTVSDADGIPAAIQWQWYRDGVAIGSANAANYQLTAADIGATISVGMRYTDDQGYAESIQSPSTGVIAAFNYAPQGEVRISGNPQPGEILRVSNTITDANGISGAIQFIWQRDGEIIEGQTGSFYALTEADRGATISVLAVYTDARGFEEMVLSNLVEVSLISPPENPTVPPANINPLPPIAAETSPTLENGGSGNDQNSTADEQTAQNPDVVLEANDDFMQSAGSPDQLVRVNGSAFDAAAANASGDFLNFNGMNGGLQQRYENVAAAMAASVEKILMTGALQSVIPSLQESFALLNNSDYSRDMRQALQDIKDSPTNLTAAIVGGTAAVSTGLSVGYVIWTLRSGILVTGLLSSLPAWRFIDPLPILSGASSGDSDEDDESLESLVADNRPVAQSSDRAGVQ